MNPSFSNKILAGPFIAAMLIAGCSGGGSSSAFPGGMPMPQSSPSSSPGNGSPLSTATLNGAPGFVNASGFTVYAFDLDLSSPGQSACNGACAQNWPPVTAPSGTLPAPFGSITRQDGSSQLTYAGRPLYTFSFDTAKGQTNGDGVTAFGGLWHIARPQSGPSPMPSGGDY
jgi:predicted lipoprotein with Yx(FWY)xxD motif